MRCSGLTKISASSTKIDRACGTDFGWVRTLRLKLLVKFFLASTNINADAPRAEKRVLDAEILAAHDDPASHLVEAAAQHMAIGIGLIGAEKLDSRRLLVASIDVRGERDYPGSRHSLQLAAWLPEHWCVVINSSDRHLPRLLSADRANC